MNQQTADGKRNWIAEKERFERLGYRFEVSQDTPMADNQGESNYFRVIVKFMGRKVGTRSEIDREAALERAVDLARLHSDDPDIAAEKTLKKD